MEEHMSDFVWMTIPCVLNGPHCILLEKFVYGWTWNSHFEIGTESATVSWCMFLGSPMLTPWHGNVFCITGPLWWESINHQPRLFCFLSCAPISCQTNSGVAVELRCHDTHVMSVMHCEIPLARILTQNDVGQWSWNPDSKVHGAYMGPTWGWQDPGDPMLAPWALLSRKLLCMCHHFMLNSLEAK